MLQLSYFGLGVVAIALYVFLLWPTALVVKRFKKFRNNPTKDVMRDIFYIEAVTGVAFSFFYFIFGFTLIASIILTLWGWPAELLISFGITRFKKRHPSFVAKMEKSELPIIAFAIIVVIIAVFVVGGIALGIGYVIHSLIWPAG